MLYIIALIVTIGILVTIHEYGHYWVARRCGVKVLRFSVGFGKVLYSWTDKNQTEFAISAIPLGGYVKMLDAREGNVSDEDLHEEFTSKSVWQRIAIVSAGPIANFLFAILAYWILFMLGVAGLKPVIGEIAEGSLAEKAGLQSGLEIVSVDGKPVETWQDTNLAFVERLGESGEIKIEAVKDGSADLYNIEINSWLSGTKDPEVLSSLGLSPFYPLILPIMESIEPGSRAEAGGLMSGDLVVSANKQAIDNWQQWVEVIQAHGEKELEVLVDRDGGLVELTLIPEARNNPETGVSQGFLGATVEIPEFPKELIVLKKSDPISSIWQALDRTATTITLSLKMFGKMLTGQVSFQNLSGPVSIAKMAGESISSGPEVFLGFLAFISVSLGVFNLLPVPMLDGGHLLYYVIEVMRGGKPLPEKVQQAGFQIGASLLFTMVVFAIYFDLMRL